ncbi:MAG: radical SAM protein [Myxococcales bacterium]|nr:radical SAM protein [Myxococcales bacterium]
MADERLLHPTLSLCPVCREAIPARVIEEGGAAWMLKRCEAHGPSRVRLSPDAGWYERMRAEERVQAAPRHLRREIERGCPFDCGPCATHGQRTRLPIVTLTSACNLECPICYVHNKSEDPFLMGREELAEILRHLREEHAELELLNFTGGEPTLHPDLLGMLQMAIDAGIRRVSICTNGIRLVQDEGLLDALAAMGVRVALSLQSYEPEVDRAMQGASLLDTKQRCLELLEAKEIDTILIPVMTRGLNDHEIGRILAEGLRRPNVRHVEVHTMTFTGPGGAERDRGGRISMLEVLERIEEASGGTLRVEHFLPSPCAHPLCYQIAYLLIDPEGGAPIPFLDFITPAEMREVMSEHLYLEPSPRLEGLLREAIDRLWAEGGQERTLSLLEGLLRRMFPRRPLERQASLAIAEQAVKAVYVHSHMDEETFDVERLAQCCDCDVYEDGRHVPVCANNVLYRDKEARFMEKPRSWSEGRRGARQLPILTSSQLEMRSPRLPGGTEPLGEEPA